MDYEERNKQFYCKNLKEKSGNFPIIFQRNEQSEEQELYFLENFNFDQFCVTSLIFAIGKLLAWKKKDTRMESLIIRRIIQETIRNLTLIFSLICTLCLIKYYFSCLFYFLFILFCLFRSRKRIVTTTANCFFEIPSEENIYYTCNIALTLNKLSEWQTIFR